MSLSAHLVESHERKPYMAPPISPYPQSYRAVPQHMQTPGNMSMAGESSWMMGHGTQMTGGGGFTKWSEEKVAALQVRLARKLGPEYITQRPGPGGGPKLSYIEGWKVINLANEVFGFNGWCSTISSLTTDFIDTNEQGRFSVNVTAIIRITLADGTWHEDVGCGQGDNQRSKAAALDKAKKEAVTDGIKRTLKCFGNLMGLCLYDRAYTQEVVRMKVPQPKFNPKDLERRPEFAEPDAPGPSRPTAIPSHMSNAPRPPAPQPPAPMTEVRPETPQAPDTPLREIQDLGEDVFMDESFDAEFMNEHDDTFFQRPAQPIVPAPAPQQHAARNAAPTEVSAYLQPPQNPAGRYAQTEAPTYQHRHCPDIAPQVPAGRKEFSRSTSDSAQQLATSSRAAAIAAAYQAQGEINRGVRELSSGSGDETLVDGHQAQGIKQDVQTPTTRQVNNTSAGKSARALAISSALAAQGIQPPPLPRAESPRIPSGGVGTISARATGKMPARAVALGLEREGTPTGEYQGFTSARGFKRTRSTEERHSASPTKSAGSPSKIGAHQTPGRSGPRKILGELPVPDRSMEDTWSKRARGG